MLTKRVLKYGIGSVFVLRIIILIIEVTYPNKFRYPRTWVLIACTFTGTALAQHNSRPSVSSYLLFGPHQKFSLYRAFQSKILNRSWYAPFPLSFLSMCVCINYCSILVLSMVDHFVWFRYFHVYQGFTFTEILAYFTICVWLIPFTFFISLSSNDNFLPGISLGDGTGSSGWRNQNGGEDSMGSKPRMRTVNRLLSIFNFLRKKRQDLLPSSVFNVKAL